MRRSPAPTQTMTPGSSANVAWCADSASHRSCSAVALRHPVAPSSEATLLDPALFAAHGGAFPINIVGVGLVGTVAVSGLPQADDHAMVVAVLTEFLGKDG